MVLPWSDSAGSLNTSSPRAKPPNSRSTQFVIWKLYIVALRLPSHHTLKSGCFLCHPPAASARQVSLTRTCGRCLGRLAEQDDVGGAKKTQNRASGGETGETARPAQSGLPHERMLRVGGRDYGVVQGWERAVGIPRHHRISSNVTPLCFFCMRTTVELEPLTADGTTGARRRLSRTSSPSSTQRQVVLFFPRRAF